jgi:hypothetical protein
VSSVTGIAYVLSKIFVVITFGIPMRLHVYVVPQQLLDPDVCNYLFIAAFFFKLATASGNNDLTTAVRSSGNIHLEMTGIYK